MVTVAEIFRNITGKLESTASVKTVYGEPISSEGKTIIPVSKVRYAFGAGGGSGSTIGENLGTDPVAEGSGGGGGGAVEVTPLGIVEITAGETRYIPFEEKRRMLRILLIGVIIAAFLLRRRRRRA